MRWVISDKGKLDEPTWRVQTPTSANPESLLCGVGQIQDRLGSRLLKMLFKRTATGKTSDTSKTRSLLSQLSDNTFNLGGRCVIVSRSTEARQIHSRGKGTLEISALLLYSVPCDPATDQPPVASIVPCSAPHCSLAIGDGAHSMGW